MSGVILMSLAMASMSKNMYKADKSFFSPKGSFQEAIRVHDKNKKNKRKRKKK
jgi:hypothetical protein